MIMADASKFLIKFPSITDQNAWLDFVREARKFYPEATPLGFKEERDFKPWLDKIIQLNLGNSLTNGETPTSTFFMYVDTRLVGYLTIKRKSYNQNSVGQVYINIRPSDRKKGYGTYFLKEGLNKCKAINIHQVIMSCPEESIGGARLIEKNGGVLQETKYLNGSSIRMKIYTIDL